MMGSLSCLLFWEALVGGDSSTLPVGLEQSRLSAWDPPGEVPGGPALGSCLSSGDITGLDLLRLG